VHAVLSMAHTVVTAGSLAACAPPIALLAAISIMMRALRCLPMDAAVCKHSACCTGACSHVTRCASLILPVCRAVRDAVVELLEEAYKVDPRAVMNHLANTHLKAAKRAHICAVLNIEEPRPTSVTPVSYSISRATTRDEVRMYTALWGSNSQQEWGANRRTGYAVPCATSGTPSWEQCL
jgi:hypothetical protein